MIKLIIILSTDMRFLTFSVLFLIGTAAALAQQYPFRNYFVKDGLTRNAIRAIYQDTGGWMWFATSDGVDRYDGASFTHFTKANGLSDDFINDIAEDIEGTLWVATNFAGLTSYREGHFKHYLIAPEAPGSFANRVNKIYPDLKGNLWLATDRGVYLFKDEQFTTIDHSVAAINIASDNTGNIWVGTTNGLKKIVEIGNSFSLTDVDGYNMEIISLAFGYNGILCIGTSQGLLFYSIDNHISNRWQEKRLINYLQDKRIRCLKIEKDNTLWIGVANRGVVKVTTDGMITTIDESNGLAGNTVTDIFRDSEGNMWFATSTGLSKLTTEQIINYTRSDGLPDYGISSIVRDDKGRMWFGTQFGLTRMDNDKLTTFTMKHGLLDNYVLCLLIDKNNNLWCGAGGPNRISLENESQHFITYGPESGWDNYGDKKNRVRAMYQDDEDNIWFGNDIGVSLFSSGKFITHPVESPSDERLVTGIVRDNSGDLWVGLYDGGILNYNVQLEKSSQSVLRLKKRIGAADGLKDENIRCAYKTSDGTLWFGTRFGGAISIILNKDNTLLIKNYNMNDGLVSNWVNGIIEDKDGNIWLATSRGVNKLTLSENLPAIPQSGRQPGQAGSTDAYVAQTLTFYDGLAGDGVNSIYEDVYGFLWFGTYNGVTRYDPSINMPASVPPPVYITNFVVSGYTDSTALMMKYTELDYDHQSIAFEFIGISFRNETELRYQYMLDGFDSTWNNLTDHRYANYTHLPPGDYIFKVKALNGAGVWSPEPASFAFTVAPPFWATWWFILLSVLSITALALFVHRFRLRQAVAVERMRLRIAADLHDDIGSTLSSIAIAGEMAQKESAENSHTAETLVRITESSRGMLEHLDDIVWTINPGNDILGDVLLKMREFSAEIFEAKGIIYEIDFPKNNTAIKIPMEKRRHLYLIFKEAVNNLARYSCCTNVRITVKSESKILTLIIEDDGKGFDFNTASKGNGLNNMKKRAAAIGAVLDIKSEAGKGTTVHLMLPLT